MQTRKVELPKPIRGPEPEPLTFEVVELNDGKKENPANFLVCFYRRGTVQTAVAYQYPEADKEKVKPAIDWSLKSFEMGEKAQAKRAEAARGRAR